jgi:hypothetical protein
VVRRFEGRCKDVVSGAVVEVKVRISNLGKGSSMGRKFEDDIASELRGRRPSPTDDFVRSLSSAVRPRPSARTGRRLAVAFTLSVVGVFALSITAGIAQPLAAPKSVASVITKVVTAPETAATREAVKRQAAAPSHRKTAAPTAAATKVSKGTAASADVATPNSTAAVGTVTSTNIAGKQTVALPAAIVANRLSTTSFTLVEDSPANDQYVGNEGCTPGFWKNHAESYPSGVTASSTLASVGFTGTGSITFDQALNEGGGAVDALLRHAAAAYLNALSVDYPLSAAQVVAMTNEAITSGDADTIESLKDTFDAFNNAGASGFCD